ncbi:MAG: DUF4198 domain-containing protein [Gemmataceae bacterium]
MVRIILATTVLALAAVTANAHFVFVVPAKDAKSVTVVFSEDTEPDEAVDIGKVAGLKLTGRFAGGKEAAVECKAGKHSLTAELAQADPQCVYGTVTYGLMSKKDAKPTLLVYHPKAVFAGCDPKFAVIGEKAVLEVVQTTAAGKTKFQLLAQGKPAAEAEGSVLLPDGKKEKVKTDKDGYTADFDQTGRYAVWLRQVETKAGEHDGKKYEEVRHYATLVTDALAGKGK